MTAPVLEARHLQRHFGGAQGFLRQGRTIRAVEDVSLTIRPGETLGLVGESGCGKTTTGRMIVGLDRPTAGSIHFEGQDLAGLTPVQWRQKRRRIQIIFQNPRGALDPRMAVGRLIREPLDLHGIGERQERDGVVAELMAAVALAPELASRYPHQISGGQAQRVMIARALALQPSLIVCDEPVSALDVSVQATVTSLLSELQRDRDLAYLFISHDLRVVKKLSHRVAVMYLGSIVEEGDTDEVYRRPLHPYTMALISAIPDASPGTRRERLRLTGDPPSPADAPQGCRFHTRCPFAVPRCAAETPELRSIGATHRVRCHLAPELSPP